MDGLPSGGARCHRRRVVRRPYRADPAIYDCSGRDAVAGRRHHDRVLHAGLCLIPLPLLRAGGLRPARTGGVLADLPIRVDVLDQALEPGRCGVGCRLPVRDQGDRHRGKGNRRLDQTDPAVLIEQQVNAVGTMSDQIGSPENPRDHPVIRDRGRDLPLKSHPRSVVSTKPSDRPSADIWRCVAARYLSRVKGWQSSSRTSCQTQCAGHGGTADRSEASGTGVRARRISRRIDWFRAH